MEVTVPPDGTVVLNTPRFSYQHPLSGPRTKHEDDVSPKSVIADMRFISPASSSSSSMDRRNLSEASHVKWQPRHDRGYSISDGEFSDPDTFVDSTGTSRELGKVGNSGPLESLPETHSLALEATSSSLDSGVVETSNGLMRSKWGDSESNCRGQLISFSNASVTGPTSSELEVLSALTERGSEPGDGQNCSTATHAPARLGNDKDYQDGHDQAISMTVTRSNSDAHTSSRGLQTPASVSAIEDDEDQIQASEWSSQTATSCESASELDGKESSSSSTKNYTGSESESQPADESSRTSNLPSGMSLDTSSLDIAAGDAKSRRLAAGHGPYIGNPGVFGYPGTPLRFFPGWQAHLGSPPVGGILSAGSPRAEKGIGSYSPASLSDFGRGLRFQHRFLSGPILGSMIPKPPPSKWDDAEKWIASPGHHESPVQPQHRSMQALVPGRRHSIAGQGLRSYYGVGSPEYATPTGEKPLSPKFEHTVVSAGKGESLTHSASQKKRSKTLSFGDLSRRFDISRSAGKPLAQPEDILARGDGHGAETATSSANAGHQSTHVSASEGASELNEGPGSPRFMFSREARKSEMHQYESSKTAGSTMRTSLDKSLTAQISKHARSVSMKEIGTTPSPPACPPAAVQAPASHRDMGTQMTPIESQKNSTCTTPGFTTSPTRHNTPARSGRRSASLGALPGADVLELKSCHFAKLELRKLAGDGQPTLDRNVAWNTREEEDMESSASLRQYDLGNLEKGVLVARATAWEEAEQTKYTARYNKEEAKIKAWEELQKAKAEDEMQKVEMKVEKMRAAANEKMKNRIAVAARKAEEMRAAAQAVRTEQASKTARRAEQIRTTGRLSPRVRSSFRCCFVA